LQPIQGPEGPCSLRTNNQQQRLKLFPAKKRIDLAASFLLYPALKAKKLFHNRLVVPISNPAGAKALEFLALCRHG
jgi:hypothetical protein